MYERLAAITGMARSGTSWIGQIVDSSPEVRYRMSPLFSYEFKNRIREGATRTDWEEVLRGAYVSENEFMNQTTRRNAGEYPTFATKQPNPSVLVIKYNRFQNLTEEMIELLPEMKVLAVVRHPCGAMHSWLTAPKEFPPDAEPLEHWRSGAAKKSDYGDFFGFDDWCWVTRLHLRLARERPDQGGDGAGVGRGRRGERVPLLPRQDHSRHLALARQAPGRELDPSDDGVEEEPRPREEEDEQQPGAGGGRAPALRHVHQHDKPDGPLTQDVQEGNRWMHCVRGWGGPGQEELQ